MDSTVFKQNLQEIIQSTFPVSSKSMMKIVESTQRISISKNEVFIPIQKWNSAEYFMVEGISRSFVHSPEGDEVTIDLYKTGDILPPFVTRTLQGKSNLNFQSLTPCIVGEIDASKFEELMVKNLEIRGFGNRVLKNELDRKMNKEIGLASLTSAERLKIFRENFPGFENIIPHSIIANYLGITHVSLSRLRGSK